MNILKPEIYSSYKIEIDPEIIFTRCEVTTANVIEIEGYEDSLIGFSVLHGTHIGNKDFFKVLYPKKGKPLRIRSCDYERVLLWVKNDKDITPIIERVETCILNWLTVYQDYVKQE